MPNNSLGKLYEPGAVVFRQGDSADCMYVIQDGEVEVVVEQAGRAARLAVRGAGDFFGEMAVFEHELRMATVQAIGPARILKVDRKNLLRSIQDDPSLAFHIMETLSRRVRELSLEVTRLRTTPAATAHPESQASSPPLESASLQVSIRVGESDGARPMPA